jgi:predicted PurR-regulated permease PerM
MPENKMAREYKALQIATIIALLFGAYFLRHYFGLIVFAAIVTFLFNPIYQRFRRRFKRKGTAASWTLVISVLVLIIPLVFLVTATIYQINHLLDSLSNKDVADFGQSGQQVVDWVNNIIAKIPGMHPITVEQLQHAINTVAQNFATTVLNLIKSSVSGISGFITNVIIYIYVFLNLLIFQDELIELIKKLNPLGRSRSEVYLSKMGSMTKAMARGQFIIATVQGFTDALLLYFAGLKSVFLFMFLILTVLSIIPLGGGIIVIPIGAILLLTGHIWQGLLVLVGHFLLVTNEDNILRPKLVPKESYLNPALTLLSVFAGVRMFGFLGIIIGPVIMILIVSTIHMYLDYTRRADSKT